MKAKRTTLFILLVVYASANLHAAEPLPVEYFVKHGDFLDLQISPDGKLLLVYVSSDVNPGEYYLFDTETNHAALALAKRSWVDPEKMHGIQPISLTARDGLALHGYLTLPEPSATNTEPSATKKEPSATNKKSQTAYPLIVIPHGGPHGLRDYWEFDAEAQLFASRGYAVLQVNFRGSGGYGKPSRRPAIANGAAR